MNFKQIMIVLGIGLMSQNLFAQFTDATFTGKISVGSGFFPSAPAKVSIFKTHTGLPASGAPFTSYTTGLQITHRFSGTGSSYTNYVWDMGANYRGLHFHHGNINQTVMSLTNDRQVGIGLNNPNATLHVRNFNGTRLDAHIEGFTLLDGNQASLLLGAETGASHGEWGIEYNPHAKGLNIWKPYGGTTGYAGTNYHLFIRNDGKVSIGLDPTASSTFNGDYKLYVDKGILTEKLKVALKNTTDWADYVFADNYQLMPLDQVNAFVKEHKHLPGVPSAEEVQKEGIDVAKMDAKLLEKIEELTLYMIQLKEENKALKAEVEVLKNKIK
ncbi:MULTISPECIES: hypothetical protein [unclassified Aureispira]|uniref:hypothetical protein n=1 Tax=unclassified Aureispira TaxID=2649989 RepID=UPI000697218B|nr:MULTISPECIES: hypothetical protein [unclassified Aureispira]WMX13845.1 hypothetical protein QP953_23620 [Aureispira sp. CCB-E]